MIIIHTIDIITGDLVALTKVEGSIGVELFEVINNASKDMTDKISKKLPMIDKEEYERMKKSRMIKKIINSFLRR